MEEATVVEEMVGEGMAEEKEVGDSAVVDSEEEEMEAETV